MAGRGRGGKSMSINVEALGFGYGGDSIPAATMQPPPLFPPLSRHPLPLEQGDAYKYLIDLKRDFQVFMEDSPYFLKPVDNKQDIERYSDKYKTPTQSAADQNLLLMDRMPEELKAKKRRKKKDEDKDKKDTAVKAKMAALEKTEGEQVAAGDASDDAESNDDKSDNEDQAEDEIEDEEELEEENDYIQEYFDNGDGFLDADDDGLDDGPVY